jgi:sterol desaturase/sphingolipid hydroxylase (fatty acid hydroxylase superfamily)
MEHESLIRLGFFSGILLVMMLWEFLAPRRPLSVGRSRWIGNLGVTVIGTLAVRFAAPVLPVALAEVAARRGWGIISQLSLPEWAAIGAGIIALDLVIYIQHVMFHALPSLWRLHMMHHADLDIDTTTGLRFHPLEILISLFIKLGAVALLGVPAVGVIAFEIILNGMAMFNHGNVRMPLAVDAVLRLFVVTPDMHRVHHSVVIRETNSNFGFNLSFWDRLFGTYRAQPGAGHLDMTIGVSHLREAKWKNLFWMLALPFIRRGGAYPLGRYGRGLGK